MDSFTSLFLTLACAVDASVVTYFVCARALGARLDDLHRRISLRVSERVLADRAVVVMALVYVVVIGVIATLKHYALTGSSTDLAQYDQLIWNSLHGRLFEGTIVRDAPVFLAKTFTPILLAFIPLYTLWSDPTLLLIFQTLVLGVGGFPIYWFARERLGPFLGLVLAAAYYTSPALAYMNLDEFHEITLVVPLLSLALYFLMHRRYGPFLATLAVTFLVKEEIALIAVGIGIFILLFQRAKALGIALSVSGAVSAWLLLVYVIPHFRGGEPGSFYYVQRYGYLGTSLTEILLTIFTRPGIALQHVLGAGQIEYVLQLLVPLAFIPLVGIELFALTLPTFGYTLLSDVAWQYSIRTAYPAPILPFLFFAAVLGLQRLLGRDAQITVAPSTPERQGARIARQWALGALILVASVLSYYLQGPAPLARAFRFENYAVTDKSLQRIAPLASIPHDAVVVAQNEYLAHVTHRQFVYEIPSVPDYRQADYLIADASKEWYNVHRNYWGEYLASGYFEVTTQMDGYLIARPRVPDRPLQIRFGKHLDLLAYTLPPVENLSGGMMVRPIIRFQATEPIWTKYQLVMQVVDPQGHVWAVQDRAPAKFARAGRRQVNMPIDDQYNLDLPPTIPAGEYQLTAAVHSTGGEDWVEAVDGEGKPLGTEIVLTTIRVEKDKSSVVAGELNVEQPLQAELQELRLLGFVPPRETIKAGELLQVGLYWRARARPAGDYVVAVQLFDSSGRFVFEHEDRPAKGTYPTLDWGQGEVLLDWHDFDLPKDIAPGTYEIRIALHGSNDRRPLGETRLCPIVVLP